MGWLFFIHFPIGNKLVLEQLRCLMNAQDNKDKLTELLSLHSSRTTTEMIADWIQKHPSLFNELITISSSNQYPECMRAAWAMQICCATHPKWILKYLPSHSSILLNTKYDGVKRNFLKILADHVDICQLPEPDEIINAAFDILANPKEAVANRVYAMEIIFQYGKKEPDLLNELQAIIEYEIGEAKAAFRSRGNRILKAIAKNK